MPISMPAPLQSVPTGCRTSRRLLLALFACFGLALAACTSTSKASEQYVVLESHKFT